MPCRRPTKASHGALAPAAASPPVPIAPRASTGGAAAVAAEIAVAAPAPALAPTQPVARGHSPRCLRARSLCRRAQGGARARRKPAPAPMPRASRADASRRAGNARQPAAHQRRDARGRETADRAGRHPLLPDRALVAGRGGSASTPQLGATGRIGRENWIEQAQILSRGGDTAFSRDYDRRARGETGGGAAAPRQARRRDPARNSGEAGGETPRGPARTSARCDRSAPRPTRTPRPAAEAAQRVGAEQGAALGGSSRI